MKWPKLFKQGPPYAETRQKLCAAIESGKITEETDVATAVRLVFGPRDHLDSHNLAVLMVLIKLDGSGFDFPVHNARELLWLLERLDRRYELKHQKQSTD